MCYAGLSIVGATGATGPAVALGAGMQVFNARTEPYTVAPPPGSRVLVEMWSAGGGGSGYNASIAPPNSEGLSRCIRVGGGGGAGSYIKAAFSQQDLRDGVFTISVGKGGKGGDPSSIAGSAGGDTIITDGFGFTDGVAEHAGTNLSLICRGGNGSSSSLGCKGGQCLVKGCKGSVLTIEGETGRDGSIRRGGDGGSAPFGMYLNFDFPLIFYFSDQGVLDQQEEASYTGKAKEACIQEVQVQEGVS